MSHPRTTSLPPPQENGIRSGILNASTHDVCGRCLRRGHAMRYCPAHFSSSWQYSDNPRVAEELYQQLRQELDASTPAPNHGQPPSRGPFLGPRGPAPPRPNPWNASAANFNPGGRGVLNQPFVPPSASIPCRPSINAPSFADQIPLQPSLGSGAPSGTLPTPSNTNASLGSIPSTPSISTSFSFPLKQHDGVIPVDYGYWKALEGTTKPGQSDKPVIYTSNSTAAKTGPTAVFANYIRVKRVPDKVFVYTISNHHAYEKKEDMPAGRKTLKQRKEVQNVFEELKSIHLNPLLLNVSWATDYVTLWTDRLIFNTDPEQRIFSLDYISLGGQRLNPLQVEVKQTKTLDTIRNNLRVKKVEDCSEEIEALNALVTHPVLHSRPDFSITPAGQNRFYINEAFEPLMSRERTVKKHNDVALRAVRGYYTSVRPGKNSEILLNVNTATTAFFPPSRVSDVLFYIGTSPDFALEVELDDIGGWLRGIQLYVAYKRKDVPGRAVPINDRRSRLKSFQNFGRSIEEQKFFDMTNPQDPGTTVRHYFENDVGITGLDPTGLCVNVGKKVSRIADMRSQSKDGAIWIPAQLLEIVPYQTVKSQLPPALISAMIAVALRKPANNARLIVNEGLDVLRIPGRSRTQGIQRPGFIIDTDLVEVPANFLDSPRLQYQSRNSSQGRLEYHTQTPRFATWNLAGNKLNFGGSVGDINVFSLNRALELDIDGHTVTSRAPVILSNILERLKHHGLRVLQGRTGSGTMRALEGFWSNTAAGVKTTLVALPNQNRNTYASIRRMSDLQFGLTAVCAVTKDFPWYENGFPKINQPRGFRMQHLDNLVMKFNSKSSGVNHKLDAVTLQRLLGDDNKRENTIVFGADVGHPGSGALAGVPSIACVVASLDTDLQNYPGSMRLQAGGQENIEDMQAMALERLEAWTQNPANQPKPEPVKKGEKSTLLKKGEAKPTPPLKRLPTSILFYRDGLSESQFDKCMAHEVKGIQKAFQILADKYKQPDAKLKLTFVVVGKRHHTRFFPKTEAESHRSQPDKPVNGNVKPGLLVEDVVTTPHAYNFYLQSHAAPAGTARSAHYHVLLDEMNFGSTDRRLAEITNVLCYCFPRALKGVSYVAPAYIADRMCERGRVWLRPWRPDAGFKLPKTDSGVAWDKDGITRWKHGKALELARNATLDGPNTEKVWTHFDDRGQAPRYHPWHKNLDESMFWM